MEHGYLWGIVWVGFDPARFAAGVLLMPRPAPAQPPQVHLSARLLARMRHQDPGIVGSALASIVAHLQGPNPAEAWAKQAARSSNFVYLSPPMAGVATDIAGEANRLMHDIEQDLARAQALV